MGRKATPQPLAIPSTNDDLSGDGQQPPLSSQSLKSPKSPRSPFRFSTRLHAFASMQGPENQQKQQAPPPASPTLEPPSPPPPPSQQAADGQESRQESRDKLTLLPVKSAFFSPSDPSKQPAGGLKPQDSQLDENRMSRDTDRPARSTRVSGADTEAMPEKPIVRRPVAAAKPSGSSTPPSSSSSSNNLGPGHSSSASANAVTASGKKSKAKPFSLINRSRSQQGEQDVRSPTEPAPITIMDSQRTPDYGGGMKTAPLRPEHDRAHREIMNASTSRTHSADRLPAPSRSNADRDALQSSSLKNQSGPSSSQRDNGGFLSGLKNSASKGVGLGKGVFGKFGRNHGTNEKEPLVDDANYVLKVINQPLVQQTRITRIAKRLEESRDKTEFWMPAFPWRAIDYLNYRGTETEGLYRVPGSGPEIKKWQRRFDTEYDIDLFAQDDLYDINIIGSMLKSWLRELPDELLPKSVQDRVGKAALTAGHGEVPQALIDELSNLQPYNYYLLFAITCHLSLLLAHSEKNKMDFRNLCICFQPCMKIDATSFKFLVVDWAQCWKGCKTEDYWLDQEYSIFDGLPSSSGEGRSSTALESHDERNVSSSDSSQPPTNGERSVEKGRALQSENSRYLQTPKGSTGGSNLSADIEGSAGDATAKHPRTPVRAPGGQDLLQALKPLSPIEPLSPMKF